MTPYYSDEAVTLYHGDCVTVLATLPDASVDAVVTDPPYALGFMGKDWDRYGDTGRGSRARVERAAEVTPAGVGHTTSAGPYLASGIDSLRSAGRPFQQWCELWAAECLRVLKPGGHLLAFGGTRTYHRLTCAVEDVGFEVRDSISWLYGSGFPKSLDVSKAINKAAGAERKDGPRQWSGGQRAAGILGDNLGTQTRTIYEAPATDDARQWHGWGTALKPAHEPIVVARKPLAGTVAANVLTHGTGALNIDGCRVASDGEVFRAPQSDPAKRRGEVGRDLGISNADPSRFQEAQRAGTERLADLGRWPANVVLDENAAAELDRQSGTLTSGANPTRRGNDKFRNAYGDFEGQEQCVAYRGADTGGASRFFPTFRYEAKAPTTERPTGDVLHPTVKPLDLIRWLVRLVTPPGGTVVDPFLGSGTTAEACLIEGFRCIGIEREADYLPLIRARLSKPIETVLDFGTASA